MTDHSHNIEFAKTAEGGTFYIPSAQGEPHLAEVLWRAKGNGIMDVYRTFSDPSLRGQGIARKLIDNVAAYAQKNNLRIVPTCWYAAKVLRDVPAYQSLIV